MRAHRLLLVLVTAGLAIGEAALLKAAGYVSALGLAPQLTAPPPFGIFHGLRWLFVYNTSWAAFAAEAAGLIMTRSLLATGIIVLAWPARAPCPRLRTLLLANAGFSAVAVIILSPWACLAFAVSGTSLSWFVFGEVTEFVLLALVLQRGGIVPRWWLGLPSVRAAGLALATFVVLTVGSLVINLAPGWWAVPTAGAAGTANAVLWYALIRAVLPRPRQPGRAGRLLGRSRPGRRLAALAGASVAAARRLRAPALSVPAALAVTGGGLVLLGHLLAGGRSAALPAPLRAPARDGRSAVLYVGGYDSTYGGAAPVTTSPGLIYQIYSYRGLDRRGRPLPYTALATHQSLAHSARLLAAQVQALHQRTRRPVGIVAESEGTLVARSYLTAGRHRPVVSLVMFSPLIRPSRVYYPPSGAGSGFGYVTGRELRGMLRLLRDTGGSPESASEPFVRSMIDNAPLYRNHMLCPAPGVRSIAFLSLASAAVAPPGPLSRIPVVEWPGAHASLEGDDGVRDDVVRFLRGKPVRPARMTAFGLLRDAAAAWLAPALPLSANPGWHYPAGAPDAAFGGPICQRPG